MACPIDNSDAIRPFQKFSDVSGISAERRRTECYFNEFMKVKINLIVDYFIMELIYGTVLEKIDDINFFNCIMCAKDLGLNNLEYDESHIEKLSDYIIENHLMYGGNLVHYDNYIKGHSDDEIVKLMATAFVNDEDEDLMNIHSITSLIDYMETHDLDVEISPYKNDHPVGNAIKSFIIMYIIESNENDEINSEIDNICNVINFCHTYVNNVYVNKIFLLLFEHLNAMCPSLIKIENRCAEIEYFEFVMECYNLPLIEKLLDIDNPTFDQICFYSHQYNLQDSDFMVAQLIDLLYINDVSMIHDDEYYKPHEQLLGVYFEGFEHLAGPPLSSRFINYVPNTTFHNFTYIKTFVPNSPFHIVEGQFTRDGNVVHSFKCNKINNGKITNEPCDGIGHICFLENNFHEIYEDNEKYDFNFFLVSYLVMN